MAEEKVSEHAQGAMAVVGIDPECGCVVAIDVHEYKNLTELVEARVNWNGLIIKELPKQEAFRAFRACCNRHTIQEWTEEIQEWPKKK